jgi:2-phosphosulfolactate phosphatase
VRIDVALVPALVRDTGSLVVVVDTLRASSSIVALLDAGVPAILPAASVEAARELRVRLPDHILCGEVDGLPPPGFDYGNSPVEFASLPPDGRRAILATSNGTRILNELADRPAVLVGALLNREAAAAAALALAREHGCDITVVCAAAPSGKLALEDALGAGAIAEAALRLDPSLQAGDDARFAGDAFLAASTDLAAALAASRHGVELIAAGLAADVEYCARLDVSTVAPLLGRDADGTPILTAYRRP